MEPASMTEFDQETIHIRDLEVVCIVGVRPEERVNEQTVLVSVEFPADFGPAAQSEELEHTVDYSAVAAEVRRFVRQGRFRLLETLARRLGEHLCQTFGLAGLRLKVVKPRAVSDSGGAAVSLTVKHDPERRP